MKNIIFILYILPFISFGQSGFNPPTVKCDSVVVLNDTAVFPYQICYIATNNGAGYSIGDIIEFNVMYDALNPTTAWYFDYFNQNTQSFVYKDNTKNGQPILGAIPPIADLKPCISNIYNDSAIVRRIDTTNTILSQLSANTDTTINPIIREIRDSIARQNIILMNESTPTLTATTPVYNSNRTLLTANTIPAPYNVIVPINTREITIQNITGSDILIATSQGSQILGTRNNITLSNPINTTINHSVFTGNITISFFNSVLGNISGVQPRVIIDFKSY